MKSVLLMILVLISFSSQASNEIQEIDISDIACLAPGTNTYPECFENKEVNICRFRILYYSLSQQKFEYREKDITYTEATYKDIAYKMAKPIVNFKYRERLTRKIRCELNDPTMTEAYRLYNLGY